MASSTTPTPPMRADWTASGQYINGSTAHPRAATRRTFGFADTTSTTSAERFRTALRRERGRHGLFLPRHGRTHGHAGRMDDVHGVDAHAGSKLACGSRHV